MATLDRFFSFRGQKKWLLVALDRSLSYIVIFEWEFAWADSALVVLDKRSSYRGGCLSRFDFSTYNMNRNNDKIGHQTLVIKRMIKMKIKYIVNMMTLDITYNDNSNGIITCSSVVVLKEKSNSWSMLVLYCFSSEDQYLFKKFILRSQGIIQKKSASSSWMLPFVIFDQKVPFLLKMVLF